AAAVVAAYQRPARTHRAEDEFRRARSGLRVTGLVEETAALREGRDHQAVPGGEDLVVASGRDPPGASGVQLGARLRERRPLRLVGLLREEDVPPVEVPARRDAVVADETLRRRPTAQDGTDLRLGPDEELPLRSVGVGVRRRIEGARRRGHLP